MSGALRSPVIGAGSWPAELDRDRAELLVLLLRDGILHRSETQPILSGDGKSARWMLDTLSVTLTPDGAELAARCLLGLLDEFESRQLATYGLTGVPLLEACILGGAGRYRGALVRKERKPHGSLKLIEGRLNPSEPVVVIDDSISSGYTMTECARRLESAGFEVEGGVCLVRFDFERGPARLLESGYRIAAVFDIWDDFIRNMESEAPYRLNPTKDSVDAPASTRRAEEGLHPAVLARQAISEYLTTGSQLRPPGRLDRDYDAEGGCWVSLRRRGDVYDRPARSGHWHFPGEVRTAAAADVVTAAVKTAAELAREVVDAQRTLDECAIAVTFFSELQECTVGDLDNDRFGIVVRSAMRSPRMGGALPRMPGIGNEWQQFRHAWRTNARLLPVEPYVIYRHDVEKVIEPGAVWQPTGVPAPLLDSPESPSPGPGLAVAALRAVQAEVGRDPAKQSDTQLPPVPADVEAIFVTVFANGRIVGCVGGPSLPHPAWLTEYAVAATRDARFPDSQPGDELAVSVSLLANRFEIGQASAEWVVRPIRFAEQALEARKGDRRGLLLPFVAVTSDLTPRGYVEEVLRKAGITRAPYHWTRYDCTSWLANDDGVRRLAYGLPEGAPAGDGDGQLERMHTLLTGYARAHHSSTEPPLRRYDPFADRLSEGLGAPRLAYAAWIKACAGLGVEGAEDARHLEGRLDGEGWVPLEGSPSTTSELAFLLLALGTLDEAPATQHVLASRLWAQIDGHGCLRVRRDGVEDDAYQDYAPGQALLALAAAVAAGVTTVRAEVLARSLRHYRMRFRQNHNWGAVTWLLQAFAAWGELLGDSGHTAFAYEVADWVLQYQSTKTGAFLNDHQSDSPGATTALYMEGLAALSARCPDPARAARYRSSCERALFFLDQLVYQERDVPVLPNPRRALGGLRRSLTSATVYLDYVHHALAGVVALRRATT